MFGFTRKRKPADGFRFKTLPEIRDCLKNMVGESMNIYVGTLVGHLLKVGGRTADDIKEAKARMLACLQKYVQAEILLDAQDHGRELELTDIVDLAQGRIS